MILRRLAAFAAALLLLSWTAVPAKTILVAQEETEGLEPVDQPGCGPGTSSDPPCLTIGYAVTQAGSGDTIRVMPGTYRECVAASAFPLVFVADDIELEEDATATTTILDGGGVCGGGMCDGKWRVGCLEAAGCAGKCEIDTASETGTCSNDPSTACSHGRCVIEGSQTTGLCSNRPSVACSTSTDCDDAQCFFGSCIPIRVCSGDTERRCLPKYGCPEGLGSCIPFSDLAGAPAITLADGSSLRGFTIQGGGRGGVLALGSATIRDNIVTLNASPDGGGGIRAAATAVEEDPALCLGNGTVGCETGADCSVCESETDLACAADEDCVSDLGPCQEAGTCEQDGAITCETDDDCVVDEGPCVSYAPCLPSKRVEIARNSIGENRVDGFEAAGGGILAEAGAAAGAVFHLDISENIVAENTVAADASRALLDGGGVAVRTSTLPGGTAVVSISENLATGNTLDGRSPARAAGGGISVTAGGAGTETVEVEGNSVSSNVCAGDGGGVAALVRASGVGAWAVAVDDNVVADNEAWGGGGGISLQLAGRDLDGEEAAPFLAARGNLVEGNKGRGTAGGGGLLASLAAERSARSEASLVVSSNTLRKNLAFARGGGASLRVVADSQPDANPAVASSGRLLFDHNIVTENTAWNSAGTSADGGVAVRADARGDARAQADLPFNTVASNVADAGAGGIGILSLAERDGADNGPGVAAIAIRNSIVSANTGYGISGGTVEGNQRAPVLDIAWNDVHRNEVSGAKADYDAFVGSREGFDGNISLDPLLGLSWAPGVCSPTVDAGDPAADASNELAPNGGVVNQGHTGGTDGAAVTLPDVNGPDESGARAVDGYDVLPLALAFGSSRETSPDRFYAAADIDRDGDVDGDDLAYLAAYYGTTCPALE